MVFVRKRAPYRMLLALIVVGACSGSCGSVSDWNGQTSLGSSQHQETLEPGCGKPRDVPPPWILAHAELDPAGTHLFEELGVERRRLTYLLSRAEPKSEKRRYAGFFDVLFPVGRAAEAQLMIVSLYGTASSTEAHASIAQWPENVAQQASGAAPFAVVIPHGQIDDGYQHATGPTRTLLEHLAEICAESLGIGPDLPVGITGFSQGAGLASALSCDAGARVDAVAPVSGGFSLERSRCERLQPRLQIIDPYDGVVLDLMYGVLSVPWSALKALILDRYGCQSTSEVRLSGDAWRNGRCWINEGCTEVLEHCEVDTPPLGITGYGFHDEDAGASHHWMRQQDGFATTECIVDFMQRQLVPARPSLL